MDSRRYAASRSFRPSVAARPSGSPRRTSSAAATATATAVLTAVLTATFATIVAGPVASTASAQDADAQVFNVFLPAPRELALRLTQARKAIDAGEYTDAVTQLGSLLLELEAQPAVDESGAEQPQDYFIGPRGDAGTHTSLKTEAQRLIGAMPAKGREWYELQFGAQARALLDEGVEKHDPDVLTAVSRRFFHTKAGYEATLLLGRHYMDRGQPLAAALSFKRVAEAPAAADFEPELSFLLATCWMHANQPDKARQTIAALAKKQPAVRWRLGATPVSPPADEQQALPWIEKLVGAARRSGLSDALQWLLYRGGATRNSTAAGDMPLSKARWQVPTINDPNDEKLVTQAEKRMVAGNTPSLPAFHPLAVRDTVLMRTPDVLIGVDFRTGKRTWVFPWDEMEATPAGNSGPVMRVAGAPTGASQRELELRQRLWEDAPFGQFSSDGEAVYLVHGLRFASPNMHFMPFVVGPNGRMTNARNNLTSNKLVALDLRREGSYLWVVGDDQGGGGDEPKLAGAFFLGAPLPLQGQLFVLAEINSEIRLVVLNARTGRLEWQQQIAHLETRNILVDAQRRLAGASPSYADGVLICPTSAGAVVAVDVATRTLLWGYQFQQASGGGNRQFRGFPGNVQQRNYGARWTDATVTIHDGRAVMTPVESDELYCVDLLTGKLAWPAKKREEMLYVGGVHDGRIILVGRRQVSALRLSDGEPAWPRPVDLPEGGSPSGRGILTQGHYYLPSSSSHLLKIDIATGAVAETVRTDKVLGNLICYRDEIVSQGVDGLSTYHMVTPLRERVAQMLNRNPDDGWALARLGELQLYDGKRAESLATLRRAFKLNPQDDGLRNLLVSTLLTVLRDDFAANRGLADEIEGLIAQPTQRAEFLRLMAEGMKKAGETEAAFAAFLNLAGVQQSLAPGLGGATPTESVSRTHSVRRDRWIQANLAEIYAAATAEQRTKMDQAIEPLQLQAATSGDPAAARHFLRYFGFHRSADPLRLELAARLIDADSLLEAELLLAGLESHSDKAFAGAAVAETARLLAKAQQTEHAVVYYRRLARDFSEVVCRDGRTGAQIAADALAADPLKPFAAADGWAYGATKVDESENRGLANANYGPSVALAVRDAVGAVPPGLRVAYDVNRNQSIIVRDGFGRELLQAQVTRPDGRLPYFFNSTQHVSQVRARGHLLFVSLGMDVVAVNALSVKSRPEEPIRWRQETLVPTSDANRSLPRFQTSMTSTPWGATRYSINLAGDDVPVGTLGPVTSHAVFFQKQRELLAVDLLTGETLWSRTDLPAGCELFGDDELLFVIPPKSSEAIVLGAFDGADRGKRPVDPIDLRWVASGRRLLSWSQSGQNLQLKLTDVWTGQTLHQSQHPLGSRGVPVGHDEMAVAQPDGALLIFSLVDGKKQVEGKLEPETNLQSIYVQRSERQYVVAAMSPPQAAPANVDYSAVPGGPASQLFSGKFYAFERGTGRSLWTGPAVIDLFGLAPEQPAELPALVFLRNVRPRGRNTTQTSLLCIDKRDGRILLAKDDVPVQANFHEIRGDLAKQTVTVQLGVRFFSLQFTSDPAAPAPPARAGSPPKSTQNNQPPVRGLIAGLEDRFRDAESAPSTEDGPDAGATPRRRTGLQALPANVPGQRVRAIGRVQIERAAPPQAEAPIRRALPAPVERIAPVEVEAAEEAVEAAEP